MKKRTRKEQALLTENRIFESMKKLLTEKPLAEIQIKDICLESGISNGNFYHYFPNKNSIILKLIKVCEEDLSQQLIDISNDPSKNILNILIQYSIMLKQIGTEAIIGYHLENFTNKENLLLEEDNILYQSITKQCIILKNTHSLKENFSTEEMTRELIIIFRGFLLEWIINNGQYSLTKEIQNKMSKYISVFLAFP